MFIVSLTYVAPLERVDELLEEHISYLNAMYEKGVFVASGRKIPRTGGVILATVSNESELQEVLAQDPFHREQVAQYDIIEFVPTMARKDLEGLINL